MGAFTRASKAGQRVHRERTQPENRKKYGLLEKKKDYKNRAEDYHKKEKKLKKLRKHALDRNPDEFHYHMKNSVVKDGKHFEKPIETEDTELQKQFGEVRDLDYVRNALFTEKKKIQSLRSELHLMDFEGTSQSTHTIFVDTKEEARAFNPASFFDTDPELVDRPNNRLRKSDLANKEIRGGYDKEFVKEAEAVTKVRYNELRKRMERANELEVVVGKLEVKRHLGTYKNKELQPKLVERGAPDKAAVYKFPMIRKK
ncbi:unnamed protein product, partial [Mesorhabditis spiculigera]